MKERVCVCGQTFTGAHRQCWRCRGAGRICGCGQVFTGTHLQCNRCRPVAEKICGCGRIFTDAHRKCRRCRSTEQTCACGVVFTGTGTRCQRCQATERLCGCGQIFTGTTLRCWRCLATERTCAGCGRTFMGTKRRCHACVGTERSCDSCGRTFKGHERCCPACKDSRLTADERAARNRRLHNVRRARKAAAEIAGPVPVEVYAAIRASGPCVYCGGVAAMVDHVRPLSRGGWEHESNLVPACGPCNCGKRSSLLTEWRPDRVAHAVACSLVVAAEWVRLTVMVEAA